MAAPRFTLNVDGTDYTGAQRAAAGIHMGNLQRVIDGSGYDRLTFTEVGPSPVPLFHAAQPVTLTNVVTSTVVFRGEIVAIDWHPGPRGWMKGYSCNGLRYLADRVPCTATDGTGTLYYNRVPSDPYHTADLAGLTVGQIIALALTVPDTAARLDAMGIGGYTSLSPPALPAATTNSLALLTVVPAQPVIFSGESLINQLDQFLQKWMPKFVLELPPSGILVAKDLTDVGVSGTFVPHTLTLPGSGGPGDHGVQWPSISRSTEACATRVVMRGGPESEAAWLSQRDGTIVKGWDNTDQSSWTLYDFTQPSDAFDEGDVTAVTSTSVTIQSDDATRAFGLNFWNGREATLFLYNLAAPGIELTETRTVTANTAMSAGGTATISWDSSWPITQTNYTRYRLVGKASGRIDVGRLFLAADPSTGDTGLNTYVGAHIVTKSPKPVRVANNDKTFGEYYGSVATVCWSSSGNPPFVEVPAIVEPVPSLGGWRFTQPIATFFGQTTDLQTNGYPTTAAKGLPGEVRILAMYSRGALSAQKPSSGFEGTAYTEDGLEVVKYLDYPDWIWSADATSFQDLAQQHLDSMKNAVIEGSISIYGFPESFDALTFDWALNIDIDGDTSPWSAINAPGRSVNIQWSTEGGESIWLVTLGFSTRCKPYSADSLYTHPQFAPGSALLNATQNLSQVGGMQGPGMGGIGFGAPGSFANAALGGALNALGGTLGGMSANLGGALSGAIGAMNGNFGGGFDGMAYIDPTLLGFGDDMAMSAGSGRRRKRPTSQGGRKEQEDAPQSGKALQEWRQSLSSMGAEHLPVEHPPDAMRDPRRGSTEPRLQPINLAKAPMPPEPKPQTLDIGTPKVDISKLEGSAGRPARNSQVLDAGTQKLNMPPGSLTPDGMLRPTSDEESLESKYSRPFTELPE